MKHKLLKFSLVFCLGALTALAGLRFAPKISYDRGIKLQQKVCPMFAVRDKNYCALEKKHRTLKRNNSKMKENLERLKNDSAWLKAAEKMLRPEVSLKGSMESVIYQNYMMKKEALKKAKTQNGINDLKKKKVLVKMKSTDEMTIDPKQVKKENRYCLERVKDFLADLSEGFYEEFEKPVTVNSLSRSVGHQKKLRRSNGNASQIFDGGGSAHSTGAAVDIKKRGLSGKQLKWVRDYLLEYEKAGMIEATEEYIQPNFHIMVLADYRKLD